MKYFRNITPGRESASLSGQLSKHKFFELAWQNAKGERFDFTLRFSFTGRDHAGLHFLLTIFGHFFGFDVYDHRHWDHENDRWVEYR